jgi:preprotein translocase subunit YajC
VNNSGFLILIIAFAFLWFFLIRPQKRRQVAAAQMLNQLEVGDEVLTAGGIYGQVTELHDEAVMIRIAPELEVRVARKAIGAVISREEAAEDAAEEAAEPDVEPAGSPDSESDG